MITMTNASIYSMSKGSEMAYQKDYDNGDSVRAVVTKDGWIRTECKVGCAWVVSKSYIIKANKTRCGERIIQGVKAFLA